MHLYEPHTPYEPPEPYRSRFAQPYDGEIASAESIVGELIDALKSGSVYERSVIILLSDHGEGLMDHGEQEHGILLYREALQVPLIVKLPGSARKGERVQRPAALTDVLPTVVALAGGSAPKAIAGRDLLDSSPGPRGPIYGETFYPRIHLGWSDLRSLVDGASHYIDGPEPELYDRRADAAEKRNEFSRDSPIARDMKRALDRIPADFRVPAAADAEQVKKLTALGYLSATSSAISGGSLPSPMRELPALEESRRAFRLEAEGDRRGAIAAFQQLLAKNPNIFDVQYKLAETLEAEGRWREAADAYRQAIRVSPSMAGGASLALPKSPCSCGDLEQARPTPSWLSPTRPPTRTSCWRASRSRGAISRRPRSVLRPGPRAPGRMTPSSSRKFGCSAQPAREALALLDSALDRLREKGRQPRATSSFCAGTASGATRTLCRGARGFQEEIGPFRPTPEMCARLAILYAVQHRLVKDVTISSKGCMRPTPAGTRPCLRRASEALSGDARGASAWRSRAAREE